MPVIFALLLAGYLMGNSYVFIRGLQAFACFPSVLRVVFSALYWMGALLIVTVFVFRDVRHIPFSAGHLLYQIGTGWLVFTLYMAFFLACADFARLFYPSFTYGFVISLVLTAGLLVYGYVDNLHVRTQVIPLSINKRLTDRETLRIVAISDWHLGFGTSLRQLQKNVDRINAEHPDVILIAGDLVDNSVTPVAENAMDKELKRLHAPLGIYMAPGNHDYISNINRCKDFIAQTNIQLLIDSAVALPCGLTIVGRDDRHNAGRLSAREWRTLIDPAGASVVIDHQPKGIDELQTIGAFLQVSGHTHHGQVIPFKWLTNYLFDISYGHVADNNTHIYVSSGISLWGPPFRIGTHNEIVVFECKFVDAK